MVDGGVWTYAYTLDNQGNVKSAEVTDPRGTLIKKTFNSAGYTTSDTVIVGRDQQKVSIDRQTGTNLVTRITDPLSRKTDYEHDACGNVTSVTRMAGTQQAATTSFTYQTGADCVSSYNQLTSVTDPLGHTTTFGYDASGKLLTSIQGPIPSIPATAFGYNTAGQVTSVTNPLGKTWQFGYEYGDLKTVTDPLLRTTTRVTDYAGRLASLTNPLGQASFYEYDNLNRLLKVADALLGETEFSYDPNGNLLSVEDARGGTTGYVYENMDRLQTRTDPLLKAESYLYDLGGNLTRFTDRKQQATNFVYDGFGRLTQVSYADGSTTSYSYDAASRITQVVDSISGTITLTWDGLDRLTREVTSQGTIDYVYDAAGRRTSMKCRGSRQ